MTSISITDRSEKAIATVTTDGAGHVTEISVSAWPLPAKERAALVEHVADCSRFLTLDRKWAILPIEQRKALEAYVKVLVRFLAKGQEAKTVALAVALALGAA